MILLNCGLRRVRPRRLCLRKLRRRLVTRVISVCALTFVVPVVLAPAAIAQAIRTDGTLPTLVNSLDSQNFTIEVGARQGDNLFHSFEAFSVPAGGSAIFNVPADVENVFSRVTGGDLSSIDGLIQSGGQANLFLINPAGISFGSQASLDVAGSFVFSTADSLAFENNILFSASNPTAQPLLSVSAPIGLQLGAAPGPLTTQSNTLNVLSGETLGLIGGSVQLLDTVINIPAGRITVGSVAANGYVNIAEDSSGWHFNFTENTAENTAFQDITVGQGSRLTVGGADAGNIHLQGQNIFIDDSKLLADISGAADGGLIQIDATDTIRLTDGSDIAAKVAAGATGQGADVAITTGQFVLTEGSDLKLDNAGDAAAGNLSIVAQSIEILGNGTDIELDTDGTGRGGDAYIETEQLLLQDAAELQMDVRAGGDSGNLTILAESIELVGGSEINVRVDDADATGQGGSVTVTTGSLRLIDNAELNLNTEGAGDGGDLLLIADSIEVVGKSDISAEIAEPTATGNGGNVRIETGTLLLSEDGDISLNTDGQGDSGNLFIIAESIVLQNARSSINTEIQETASGNGGDIEIVSDRIEILQGAEIAIEVEGSGQSGALEITAREILVSGSEAGRPSRIEASVDVGATGNGGSLTINAEQLQIRAGGLITSATSGGGNAGSLTIRADTLSVQGTSEDGALISTVSAASETDFAAGSIDITARQLQVSSDGIVSVSGLGNGDAGNLQIEAEEVVLSDNGQLQALVSAGDRGNIDVRADRVLLLNNSRITATASGSAIGGNIRFDSPFIVGVRNSDIVANAEQGAGGNIEIVTRSILGLRFRDDLTSGNDITATSEFGVSGTVAIQNIDVAPDSGLVQLSTEFEDTSHQVSTGCAEADRSQFVASGRGGIPASPVSSLGIPRLWSDFRAIDSSPATRQQNEPTTVSFPSEDSHLSIAQNPVEAANWSVDAHGQVSLTAGEQSPLSSSTAHRCLNQISAQMLRQILAQR